MMMTLGLILMNNGRLLNKFAGYTEGPLAYPAWVCQFDRDVYGIDVFSEWWHDIGRRPAWCCDFAADTYGSIA